VHTGEPCGAANSEARCAVVRRPSGARLSAACARDVGDAVNDDNAMIQDIVRIGGVEVLHGHAKMAIGR